MMIVLGIFYNIVLYWFRLSGNDMKLKQKRQIIATKMTGLSISRELCSFLFKDNKSLNISNYGLYNNKTLDMKFEKML